MITAKPKTGEPTHAGGVVYKGEDTRRKFLLVQAKKKPKEWVLPKGHIELDEHPCETAVREVREETEVWAEIVTEASMQEYEVDGEPVRVQFYIMKEKAEERPEDRWRKHTWLPVKEAVSLARYDQTKELLSLVDKKIDEMRSSSS